MDEELKQALIDKIKIAEQELKSPRVVKALLQKWGPQTSLERDRRGPYNALFETVHKKLRKARIWEETRDELAHFGFDLFYRNLQKQAVVEKLSDIRKQQLEMFPGFECLPTRIRAGSNYLKLQEISVPQFLLYEKTYQERAAKSRLMADELHELAEQVRPFATAGLTLAAAFERARKQAAKFLDAGSTAADRRAM
jgi:hypothetical protein